MILENLFSRMRGEDQAAAKKKVGTFWLQLGGFSSRLEGFQLSPSIARFDVSDGQNHVEAI